MTDPQRRAHLGEALEVPTDEARLSRGWRSISTATYAPSRRPLYAGATLLAAAAAALVITIAPWRDEPMRPGPLAMVSAQGTLDEAMRSAAREGGAVSLDDGSTIAIARGCALEPLENTAQRFSLLLRAGSARFDVRPGGPRRWTIEAGAVSVEVVGTAFEVRREGAEVQVSVERGRVLVRGDLVPDHVRSLGAGESIRVGAPMPEPASRAPASPVGDVGTEAMERPAPSVARATRAERPDSETSSDDVALLLAEADEERRAGRIDAALDRLATAAAREGDPQAAIASFTRGRLALDHGRPTEAVRDLRRALVAGLPPVLEETARARLVDALARSGDREGAARAAVEYVRDYPAGAWRASVARAIGE